jgi:multiple sugar transport system ATP-binding protein
VATVALENVRKSFGRVEVINDVSFRMTDGEFLALVGPSGCGKSTLLRMIAGLETVTDGDILIGERVVNDLAPKDRDIAMVFQSYALYPNLSVERNMGQPLRLAGRPRTEIKERVAEAARILSLTPLLDRYPRQLSGGQRQRVAMGRAIVRDPAVFLFDEPLSNLDAKLRVQMRSEIKELHQRLKTTTVYVTHDQVEAMTMADRVVVMQGGHIEQIGRPLDLYDRPRNLFVAGFLGSPAMNQIPGRVTTENGVRIFVAEAGLRFALPAQDWLTADGKPIVLGLRPEHLQPGGDPPALSASVVVVEASGADTLLVLREGGVSLTVLVRDRISVSPGETIGISPIPGHLHFFDPVSGLRLEPSGQ